MKNQNACGERELSDYRGMSGEVESASGRDMRFRTTIRRAVRD
jgi:hypothetical protein